MTSQRYIVVGDVHGCSEELEELLRTVELRPIDKLVFLGDLVDRGPDPVGVVRRAQELNALAVLGNHEEKHLRYRRHELKRKADPSYKNPMKPLHPDRLAQHHAFSEGDWAWMSRLPDTLLLWGTWVAVHAGFEPAYALHEQRQASIVRVRHVGADGKMVALGKESSETKHWSEVWAHPHDVIYGHDVTDTECRQAIVGGYNRLGIDTGCCFGGRLTAAVMHWNMDVELVSVPAKQAYAPRRETDD